MTKEIINEVINIFNSRKGFDDWWHNIGTETQEDIKEELEFKIKELFAPNI